jgi:SSS family solute:Na+ symporter
MQTIDFIVLGAYFGILIVIGLLCSMTIRRQEDYFMGGRGFGKLLQTFAAFGAGTGAQDPITLGRTTWTSGLSGIWSALNWLFVTPFYWIFAVWYRRMRHLTLGDWFVERYQSKALGVAYTIFAFSFQMLYLSIMFSAISKVVEPLLGQETTLWIVGQFGLSQPEDLRLILIPLIAGVVLLYGILGGLTAAYWTDLLQGICIIVLSVILIPYGLIELARRYGADYPALGVNVDQPQLMDGLKIMHDRLGSDYFQLFGTPLAGEFPVYYIVVFALMSLVGIVVQPHFIATGGGSAKTENSARMGLVTGNFLKRLCTIGWGFTGLIALALLANNLEIAADNDKVWGIASREILQPIGLGLVGLMLACLMAALMSSADCYMLVSSALLVRNVFAAYIDSEASEKTYVAVGRVAGLLIIVGAVFVSINAYDVFGQYRLALELAASFAAPFWIGMFWRRATPWAAWGTVIYIVVIFFALPVAVPMLDTGLRSRTDLGVVTLQRETVETRTATPVDVERRQIRIDQWNVAYEAQQTALVEYENALEAAVPEPPVSEETEEGDSRQPETATLAPLAEAAEQLLVAQAHLDSLGEKPSPLTLGEDYEYRYPKILGGKAVFWSDGFDESGGKWIEVEQIDDPENRRVTYVRQFEGDVVGQGKLQVEFLPYLWAGLDLSKMEGPLLESIRLPIKIMSPFLVMIFLSWVTPRCRAAELDRYYVKMKTPVDPDPRRDEENLRLSYENPSRFDHKKLLPRSQFEFQKPRVSDILGFVISFGICFAFLALIVWLARLGA